MQETVILADAACDMPRALMAELGVQTVPFRIRAGDRFVADVRDEPALPSLYEQYLVGKQDHYAESVPLLEARNRGPHAQACGHFVRSRVTAYHRQHAQQAVRARYRRRRRHRGQELPSCARTRGARGCSS
ncbi:hypothetical protein ACU4GD_28890 [Cupriavidus basilensis]